MTNIVSSDWTNAISGTYATVADWTPTGVPTFGSGNEYDVFIGGAYTSGAAAFTVTSAVGEQVGYLDVEANGTLSITGGQFLVYSHVKTYSAAVNFGTISVAAGTILGFGLAGSPSTYASELENAGSVQVAGTLSLAAPWFGLKGNGALTLSGRIVGANTGSVADLEVVASTIQGSGVIGTGSTLALTNASGSLINANSSKALTINTGTNWIYDEGAIETTGAGGLVIDSNVALDGSLTAAGTGPLTLVNALVRGGGVASVAAKAALVLNNSQLTMAGTISVASGGVIKTTTGNTTGVGSSNALVGDALQDGEIEDAGTIYVLNNSTLNLNATVYNTGAISLLGASGPTKLEMFGTGATVWNSGGITLSNSTDNELVSNGAGTAIAINTKLSGAGVIGDGWLRLVNHLGGTINASASSSLTVVADASAVANGSEKENYNDGTMENTGSGGMIFSGGTFTNAGYLVEDGAGALTLKGLDIDTGGGIVRDVAGTIVLQGNSQITNQAYVSIAAGTTLTTSAGDIDDAVYSNVLNSGAVNVVAGSTLGAEGHWTNGGSVNIGSSAAGATLAVEAGNSLQLLGAGTVNMLNASDKIVSAGAGALLQDRGNDITGGGVIGDANMEVEIAAGAKIDATLASGLVLNAEAQSSGGGVFLYNAGVLQSDSAVGLTLDAAIDNPGQMIADSGGKIFADDAVYGAGVTTINGTGSAEFHGEVDNDIHYGAVAGGDLILDSSHLFTGRIWNMIAGDTVDLRDFAYVAGSTKVDASTSAFGPLDGTLYVTNGTTDSTPLYLQGDFTPAYLTANHLAFQFASDGHLIGGTSSDGTLVKLVSTG
jgi:hypothetical protein